MIFHVGEVQISEESYPLIFNSYDCYFFNIAYSKESFVKVDGLAPLVLLRMIASSLSTKEGVFLFKTLPNESENLLKKVSGKHHLVDDEMVFLSKTLKNRVEIPEKVNDLKSFDNFAQFFKTLFQ